MQPHKYASSSLLATRTPAYPWLSLTSRRATCRAPGSAPREPWPRIPGIPYPSKNLGAVLGKEGGSHRALDYLRRSNECDPKDPQTAYRLALAA